MDLTSFFVELFKTDWLVGGVILGVAAIALYVGALSLAQRIRRCRRRE